MTFKESTFFRLLSRIRALIVLNTLRPFSVSLLSKFKTEIYLPDRRSTLPDSRGFALKLVTVSRKTYLSGPHGLPGLRL